MATALPSLLLRAKFEVCMVFPFRVAMEVLAA
jgi:hypothetical protein